MTVTESIAPFLGSIDRLHDTSSNGAKGDYIHPALRNLGCLSVVLIREIVAPTVFRGQEAEISDITTASNGYQFVRAVPGKFKHRDRANGLKLLRHFKAGGAYPQNRNIISDKTPLSQAFDMNSLVFGDSANHGKRVLPVKAAALYSDGLSIVDYNESVGSSMHIRTGEDGTLFDYASKENSNNLFTRHFILPGTLMVQVVSTIGRIMPVEAFEHLMLSLSLAGAYGGQTSITGVNVRTHVAGIFGSVVEHAETSPYELAMVLRDAGCNNDRGMAIQAIQSFLAPLHEMSIGHEDATAYRDGLVAELTGDDKRLRKSYEMCKPKIGALFENWFTGKAA